MLLTSNTIDGYAQLITVLLIFVVVLAITAVVTKYIAKYQKQSSANANIEILETVKVSATKYVQLVRIGDTYVAMAVCKDTVTKLCEVPKEQLSLGGAEDNNSFSFKELLNSALHKETKEVENNSNKMDRKE